MSVPVKVSRRRPSQTFPHARRPASGNLQRTKPRDNRGFARLMYDRQVPAEVGTIKRHPEKEPQCRDCAVDLGNAGAARRQMQLKAAYILRFGCIRGALEVICEVLDLSHIVMLCFLRELADRHVFDHAPTQWTDSLLGH